MTNIYSDGSCINIHNTCSAGYGIVIQNEDGTVSEMLGKVRDGIQTNNRAELEGVLHSLLYIVDNDITRARIYTDSLIVVDGINGNSQRKANRDIWSEIESICRKMYLDGLDVIVLHLDKSKLDEYDEKHMFNVQADRLAFKGANALLL